jgi:biopolymer transport protein ExbB
MIRAALLLLIPAWCAGGVTEEACAQVREEIKAQSAALGTTRDAMRTERAALRAELARVEQELEEAEAQAIRFAEQEARVARALEEITYENETLREELGRSFAILRENRKEFESARARTGPVGGAFDELDALLTTEDPSAAEERAREELLALYGEHFATVSGTRRVTEEVVLPDGTKESGELLLAGGFLGVYRGGPGGLRGVVTLRPGAASYRVVAAGLSRGQVRAIDQAFETRDEIIALPLDVSGGLAIRRLTQSRSLWEFIQAGGVVMIPLGLIALLSGAMMVERVIALRRADARIDPLLDRVLPLVERGDFAAATGALQAVKAPIGRVLLAGVSAADETGGRVDEVLEDAVLREVPQLERFTSTLGVFAAIAPLLGLLGTVSGMIGTFEVITAYGTGNPRLLSGGISEALITTEVGLVVAVPLLLAHAWLTRRVRTMLGHLERAAVTLAGVLRTRGEVGRE